MKDFTATEHPKSVNENDRSHPGENDMSADFGMAVTLIFWTVTLGLAACGRGRGRYARSIEPACDVREACAVYPLVPRERRSARRSENLPQAS